MRPPICDKTAPPHLENPGSSRSHVQERGGGWVYHGTWDTHPLDTWWPSLETYPSNHPPPPWTNTCENITFLQLRLRAVTITIQFHAIGGSKGDARDVPPLGVQILSFSCSFCQKKLQNNRNSGVGAPPS